MRRNPSMADTASATGQRPSNSRRTRSEEWVKLSVVDSWDEFQNDPVDRPRLSERGDVRRRLKALLSPKIWILWFGAGAVLVVLGGVGMNGGHAVNDLGRSVAQASGAPATIAIGLAMIGVGIVLGIVRLVMRNRPSE